MWPALRCCSQASLPAARRGRADPGAPRPLSATSKPSLHPAHSPLQVEKLVLQGELDTSARGADDARGAAALQWLPAAELGAKGLSSGVKKVRSHLPATAGAARPGHGAACCAQLRKCPPLQNSPPEALPPAFTSPMCASCSAPARCGSCGATTRPRAARSRASRLSSSPPPRPPPAAPAAADRAALLWHGSPPSTCLSPSGPAITTLDH